MKSSEDSFSVRVRLPNGQFHWENCAVLGEALDQPAIADNSRFAGPEIIGEVLVILGPVGFRHEHLDIAADDFISTISEQSCGRSAERSDLSLLIDNDHRLGDSIEDRTHMRLARREFRLSPLQSRNVNIVLKHETDRIVVRLSRDPQAGDRNGRSSLRPMFEFAFPTAALAQRRNNLAPWDGIFGLQKFMDDLSDRLLPGPSVKTLAARRPMQNSAFQIMDDDVGQIQDFDERVEFGAHSRSHLLGSSSRRTAPSNHATSGLSPSAATSRSCG